MAETDHDDNTVEYRLLWDEFKYITSLARGSEKIADQVLRDFLQGGATYPKLFAGGPLDRNSKAILPIMGVDYRYSRYRIWQVEGWSGGRLPNPFKREFWESDPERSIYSLMDYPNSSGRWTGPVMYNARTMSKKDIAFLWKLEGKPTKADYRAILIQINHTALLAELRALGLLPPLIEFAPAPAVAEPVQETVSEPTPKEESPTPAQEPALAPEREPGTPEPASESVPAEPTPEPSAPESELVPETKPQVPEGALSESEPPSFSSSLEFAKWGMKNYPWSSPEFTKWAIEKHLSDRDKRRKITYARYLLTFAPKNADWDARSLVNRFRDIEKEEAAAAQAAQKSVQRSRKL